jgi:transcriptional regulator with XRE-family HTH domain
MQAKRITFLPDPYDVAMNTGRPSTQPRTPFGERLHAAREARGLSQAQVAEQLGMSQNAYACWERKPVALRPDQIEQLAKILGVSIAALFNGNDGSARKGGPTGKARSLFDEVSRLPRKRQQRILATVEDMLTAQRVTASS